MDAQCAEWAGLLQTELQARYKHRFGRDARSSECGHSYNGYSIGLTVPGGPDADPRVVLGRVRRCVAELLDSVGPDTRHGLLVIRTGSVVVERLSAEGAPLGRFRMAVSCHGSSLEEWEASAKAIKEQQL